MMEQPLLFLFFTVSLAFAVSYLIIPSTKHGLKLPPGPRGLPVIGNLLDLPPKDEPEYKHWLKHKDLYGPISSLSMFGSTILVLHDRDLVHALLEKQASKTALRPSSFFADDLCGYDMFMGPYNDGGKILHRRHKLVMRHLTVQNKVDQLSETLEAEVDRFLLHLHENPDGLRDHIKTETGALFLKIVYDYAIERNGMDPLVQMIDRMARNFSVAFKPFAWSVDFIPAIRHLPEWMPGMSFMDTARRFRKLNQAVCDIPYEFIFTKLSSGRSNLDSYVASSSGEDGMPKSTSSLSEKDEDIKCSAAAIYTAGSDTLLASLLSFTLAMIMFPDVQRKAQAEIDALTGGERLPGWSDREKLPYVNALVQEVHRWSPVVPMGLAHRVEEDMEFAGYLLPKKSILLIGAWWFCHDPETYADPDAFEPQRYLAPRNEPDPRAVVFGYGRRRCPGRLIADGLLFLNIARTLAVFNISGAPDTKLVQLSGALMHPKPFKHSILPRSKRHAELLQSAAGVRASEKSDAEFLNMPVNEL